MEFFIQQAVLDLGLKIVGVVITDIENQIKSESYSSWRSQQISSLLDTYNNFDPKQDPIMEGFYTLHQKVDVPRRKNIPASENLVKLLIKKEGLFEINKAVDIYNIISMESKLALGAHDIDKVTGNITLRLTDGTENFLPLGASELTPVKPGEYSYIDDANDILCHLEIRQVEKDKVTEDSKNLFYIVQGNQETPDELLQDTARKLIEKTTEFCGGYGEILPLKII